LSLNPEKKRMTTRVIVDENVGRNTALWHEFQRVLGGQPWEYVFLSEAHPGIPDVEILDKLLQPSTVLLTGDCVLHERAIRQGIRSYTLDQQGQLTRQRQPRVTVSKSLAQSVYTDLQDDYRHQVDQEITGRLKPGLTEKQLKRYRTARRRIRSHFGSAGAISQVAVTVGSKTTRRGLLCGFVFQVAGNSGQKGLRANEGYCLPTTGDANAACAVIHALRDLYLLQFEKVRTELFVIPPESLELSHRLLDSEVGETTESLARGLKRLLQSLSCLTLHPCVKGRFFDSMQRKLDQLDRTASNEVTRVDFAQLAGRLLMDEAEGGESNLTDS
jgi:hypothetical protein